MILYVNCCIRKESRTDRLARTLLNCLGDYEEVNLEREELQPLTRETLALRQELIGRGDFSHPMFRYAKQFMQAEQIVIGAPYWDLSFPSSLKVYLENIYVVGLITQYGPDGVPRGRCKAHTLYYVTTAGGEYDQRFSYDFWEKLAKRDFGIGETRLVCAQMLDIQGYDPERILEDCQRKIQEDYT